MAVFNSAYYQALTIPEYTHIPIHVIQDIYEIPRRFRFDTVEQLVDYCETIAYTSVSQSIAIDSMSDFMNAFNWIFCNIRLSQGYDSYIIYKIADIYMACSPGNALKYKDVDDALCKRIDDAFNLLHGMATNNDKFTYLMDA